MRRANPSVWLMTDERMGDALLPAIRRLPPGSGVVFRHYHTPPAERRALARRLWRIAKARRLVLLVAGGGIGGDGVHGPGPHAGLHSWPAHDRRQAIAGVRAGATLLFVSPVYPTRSHPGNRAIGVRRAAAMTRGLPVDTIALGGMDAHRWRAIRHYGFNGWAAIDAWLR